VVGPRLIDAYLTVSITISTLVSETRVVIGMEVFIPLPINFFEKFFLKYFY